MACYISFSIDGRDLMISEDNPDDVKMWKTRSGNRKLKKPRWNQLKLTIDTNGYKSISIIPKHYRLHRVNYYAHNQTWNFHDSSPSNHIDHIDNKGDLPKHLFNNIENLRVVTHQENHFNRKCKGYYWNKSSQKWKAQIKVNGKQKYLGLFDLEEEAHQAYLEAKKIYHIIPNRK
tara:strand:- start:22 stop:546 length:525 start_codon:yes stop_codon:yes gene_type:complete